MPRISGVDIPNEKKLFVSFTYINGIGRVSAEQMIKDLGLDREARAKDLTEDELARINSYIDKNLVVEGQLRRQTAQAINRLKDIGCFRGLRHRRGLPARGQRTRTNARTRKGPRKTVAGKKKG
ncbi:MAG: 30S ribosomal protein S13 [Planctomycetota bacterium]